MIASSRRNPLTSSVFMGANVRHGINSAAQVQHEDALASYIESPLFPRTQFVETADACELAHVLCTVDPEGVIIDMT